ncbi:MAG: SAM-dependent methyltransferase [Lachnospiraceae bacterium]|nr:SAM-dependent methyltransferase [Lachnospiraceae bacterium]
METRAKIGRLSQRLSAVAEFVSPGMRLCDVGCDHAHLCIQLVKEGWVPAAIAVDVGEGPLRIARENIRNADLSNLVETRISNGLSAVQKGEAESIVLAGMGGRLISELLSKGADVALAAREWVLQPQSDVDIVRRLIRESGFRIWDEALVLERGKYYPIIKAVAGSEEGMEAVEDRFGPVLLQRRHPLLLQYLARETQRLAGLLPLIEGKNDESSRRIVREWELVQRARILVGMGSDGTDKTARILAGMRSDGTDTAAEGNQ